MVGSQTADAPFSLIERSDLFSYLVDLIQRVYRPSLQSAVHEYELVIIGGQSLTLWARQYLIDELTGEDVAFVSSDDLDFVGNADSIGYCERTMGITFRRATMDDNSPNIAAAYIDWQDGREVVVDILDAGSVGGIDKKEIFKFLAVVDIDGVAVAVIDPITCLASRLFNLFAGWQRWPHRESIRVKIAIRASSYYLRDMLTYDGYRTAAPLIKRIRELALSDLGKCVFVEYGIDVLEAIPKGADLYPIAYSNKEMPRMRRQINDGRVRKLGWYQRLHPELIHISHLSQS